MLKSTTKLLVFILLCVIGISSKAQVVSGLKAPSPGEMGKFTEWQSVDVKFDDGTSAKIEYRIALAMRKGIACHYDLEVKNNSDQKVKVRLKSNYYDKFVKSYFGEEIKETLKPGKGITGRLIAQGCKKDKGSKAEDYDLCTSCDFSASIFVEK